MHPSSLLGLGQYRPPLQRDSAADDGICTCSRAAVIATGSVLTDRARGVSV